MNIEQLQQEAENLKSIDAVNLTPEQIAQLVEKLTSLMDASEAALLGVKTQLDQVKLETEDDTDNQ
jgi:hypothetical protein